MDCSAVEGSALTVADLIEVLQQCPNLKMEVKVRVIVVYGEASLLPVEDVTEDRGLVVIETE